MAFNNVLVADNVCCNALSAQSSTCGVVTLTDRAGAGAVAESPLLVSQSGNVIVIPLLSGGTQTVALPPARAGLQYTFVQSGAAGGQILQILCDTTVAENIIGNVDNNGTNAAIDAVQLQFLAAAILGDSVTLTGIGSGAGDVWAITAGGGSTATAWSA
jgi:hypothetical protein